MSSHGVTLALYVAIVLAGIGLELLGRTGRTRIPRSVWCSAGSCARDPVGSAS
jgi:hypothetical protein